jgi:hypothetical protein
MESQRHGLDWEAAIKAGPFKITTKIPQNSVFDVPAALNSLNPAENISIKVFGADTICDGDALRVFSYKDHATVTMIAVQWEQTAPSTKTVRRIYELAVGGPAAHAILFGSVTKEEIAALDAAIKAVPHGPISAAAKAAIHTQKEALNARSGVLRFNPKMDSKSQRRLQCSIPGLQRVLTAHPALLLSSCEEAVVRGVAIPASITSAPRQRRQPHSGSE